MSDSACNGTTIKVVNSNVTYLDGEKQDITITSAGPVGNQGGSLTSNSSVSPPITVNYGATASFTASSSDGSNGNFNNIFTVQCNAANSPEDNPVWETISVSTNGQCSTINSKSCTVGGNNASSEHFSAVVTNSSPSTAGMNWITITITNGTSN